MNKRIKTIYTEILEKCKASGTMEFEYYWEIWGVLWYPWTLEINGKYQSFSFNDLSSKDLEKLCELGLIQLIKEYSKDEMENEFDRKRYKILENRI